ncbi:EAL domain-containing protein [Agrobacterium tumefaciens]|uniref:sensor domain-containing phosphodiesterase n=1 Tax=Agrobacterium tumefaciens TaxID=358 RepID=UPI00157415E1|nr:EAL domain-containing protein [Agrobacterium tumefaciens]MCZ7497328.1 EAL domain-containing protein [Rhizobium rhizogenes]NTE56542.1 EAL domain-containing protein [Agrobacterium tumefaciens]NTE74510.1 EAL domain-containing protein [Agrobacterium tumefaciens]
MKKEKPLNLSHDITRQECRSYLARAIRRGDIWPAFQPIVDIRSEALAGFEILARWSDPDAGDISPTTFIPLLEKYRLADDLSQSLMRSACAAAAHWKGRFFLAFNITPDQLLSEKLPDWISTIASETGFPLSRIQLEITESSLIVDDALAYRTLNRLNAIGVAISLDDFGTGYSSFARLEAFPFRKLKIDAQFVRGVERDKRKRRIVSAIIGLGASLDITVVAEGIETAAEAAILKGLGCPLGQGWLYGKGVPADAARLVFERLPEMVGPVTLLDTSPFQQLHQLQTLYQQAPVGLCFVDLHFRHVRANDIFASMHGLSSIDLEGKTIYDVMEGETLKRVEATLSNALGRNPLPPQDFRLGDRDFRVFAQKVVDMGGENLGFSVVSIDVTEQNRVLQTLLRSEEHFRRAVELSPHIAWSAGADGVIDYISPTFEDLPNDTMQDRIDRWLSKMHPDDRLQVRTEWLKWISSGMPWETRFRIAWPDGTYRRVLSRARAHTSEEGVIVRWYGVISDLTAP